MPFKWNGNTCANTILHNEMNIAAGCAQRMNKGRRTDCEICCIWLAYFCHSLANLSLDMVIRVVDKWTSVPVHSAVFQAVKKEHMLLSNFCISPFASCYVIWLVLKLKKWNLKGKCEFALYLPCQWLLLTFQLQHISKIFEVEYCEYSWLKFLKFSSS